MTSRPQPELPVLFLFVAAGMLAGLALALLPGLLFDLAPSAPVHIPAD